MNQQKWRRHTHVVLMSRFSNVVDCQRKKCRGFSFLFDFPFYSPARFASIDSLIHSFIHSALFGLCVSRFSSAFGFSFMAWILFHFISRHRTQTVIPMLQPPPKEVASGSFGSFIKFSKSHLVLSRSFFFCVRWKSKRLFSGVTLLQASHSLKTSRILGGVAKLPCVLPSIKVRRNA